MFANKKLRSNETEYNFKEPGRRKPLILKFQTVYTVKNTETLPVSNKVEICNVRKMGLKKSSTKKNLQLGGKKLRAQSIANRAESKKRFAYLVNV